MSEPILPGRGRGLFVGRVFGIELYLDYSWFLIAGLVTYMLGWKVFPEFVPGLGSQTYVLMGGLAALLFFLSIILHELGHSLVSQRCGIPVPRITLLFIGGLAEISREPDDAKSELKIALGGPAVSLVLIAFFATAEHFFGRASFHAARAVCEFLWNTNLALVAFNMIPGYPLDGGRVLRALLWARSGKLRQATFITSRIGIGFSWVLIALGVYLIVGQQAWNGLVFLLIAIFLKGAADSGYANAVQREVLGDKRVSEIMSPNPVTISASLPLNLVVDEFFLTNHHVAFPVADADGSFCGVLRLEMLREVPRERWPYLTAKDLVLEKQTDTLAVGADTPAAKVMRRLLVPGTGRLAVTEDGKVVGMITRHDILHFIHIHTELEP